MSPAQVSRGEQNVTGHVLGSNFSGIVAVDLDSGIKIHGTRIVNPNDLEVVFSVNADAPSGKRLIRVATPAGVATNSDLLSISDNRSPVASFTMSPSQGSKDTRFTFDASASRDPDGSITGYSWDFGDSHTASGKQATHVYNAAGNFKVKLTVTDNNQGKGTNERDVQIENIVYPVARFTFSPHNGPINTIFQFDASGSDDKDGRITDYEWDFKDGSRAHGKTVKHKFARVDLFAVELNVRDNSGLRSSIQKEIKIRGKNPNAAFTVSPSSGDASTNFQFSASSSSDSDGNIRSYDWNFGDGKTADGRTVSHVFGRTGNFAVKLKVKDNDDLEDTAQKSLSVTSGGGGGGGGGTGTCTNPAPRGGFIFGNVIGVRGQWAIVQLPAGSTCANSFYNCGDMRKAGTSGRDEFFGIIQGMKDVGNNVFEIFNACPLNWPPAIGTRVFLYWKPCSQNHCPG